MVWGDKNEEYLVCRYAMICYGLPNVNTSPRKIRDTRVVGSLDFSDRSNSVPGNRESRSPQRRQCLVEPFDAADGRGPKLEIFNHPNLVPSDLWTKRRQASS